MYVVMGLPGAGKTTILKRFKEKHPNWKILIYGTLMIEKAKAFGVKDRDELRKSPIELQKKIQKEVAKELSKIEEKEVILDTHATIRTNNGYWPGLPKEVLEMLKVEGIILITAPYKEILERREKDKTRQRDKETEESLAMQDFMNKAICSTYAYEKNCSVMIIVNRNGELERAVGELERALNVK